MVRLPRQAASRPAGIRVSAPTWLCICVLVGGCAELPSAPQIQPPSFQPSGPDDHPLEIGVLIAGWHTGIVLPTGELGPLTSLLRDEAQAKYLSFGWGNRRFYMAANPRSGDAVAALFRSRSVIFVQAMSAPADPTGDARIQWVCVNRQQLWRVDSYIDRSLSRSDGKPIDLGPGPLAESRFYASVGHYSAVHTCNTWTVAALQYAQLPVRAGGIIFAQQAGRRTEELRACPRP